MAQGMECRGSHRTGLHHRERLPLLDEVRARDRQGGHADASYAGAKAETERATKQIGPSAHRHQGREEGVEIAKERGRVIPSHRPCASQPRVMWCHDRARMKNAREDKRDVCETPRWS